MTDRQRFIEDFRHKFYKAIGNFENEVYLTTDEARNILQELENPTFNGWISVKDTKKKENRMGNFRDLTGMKFGQLTVLGIAGKDKYNKYLYNCVCDCGEAKVTHGRNLLNGSCKSCGCLNNKVKIEKSKYKGLAQDEPRLYHIWKGMIARCYNEKCECFDDYGGRGIYVCEDWATPLTGFPAFVKWARENGYQDNLTIDRMDNDGGYTPLNCRWADWHMQAKNRRPQRIIVNQYGVWERRKPLPEPPEGELHAD